MGKSKKTESQYAFAVDVKSVLAMKPEQRVKWLQKACRAAADGDASIKHVFDVLTSKKLVHGLHVKSGRRMLRTLKEHLYLFSEKQQRYLQDESPLAQSFGDVESEEEQEKDTEGNKKAATDVVPPGDSAARMEEMMARCRDFVRQNASSFEERSREAQETERKAEEARRKAVAEQRAREWKAIADWHRGLESWESACMATVDGRLERLKAIERAEKEEEDRRSAKEARRAERESGAAALLGSFAAAPSSAGVGRAEDDPGKHTSSKRRRSPTDVGEAFSRKEKSSKSKGDKDRDRDRDRERRRRDRSRSRSRRRRRSPEKPVMSSHDQTTTSRRSAGDGLPPPLPGDPSMVTERTKSQEEIKAMEVQRFLNTIGNNIGAQAYDPLAPPTQRPSPAPHLAMPFGAGGGGAAPPPPAFLPDARAMETGHTALPNASLSELLRSGPERRGRGQTDW